jgi:outer membrane protein assembly factor BamA
LLGRVAVAHDVYEITSNVTSNVEDTAATGDGTATAADDVVAQRARYSSYRLPYIEQQLVIDLRDNPLRPRLGLYFSVLAQESARVGAYGSWDYLRLTPEARVYLPMPLSSVLAARFAVGALLISDASPGLDADSQRLGPQSYRLRGGGAGGNRGFQAGSLGVGEAGGTRRWEGSLELRVPLGGSFGLVLFGDVGDVSDTGAEPVAMGQSPRSARFEWKRLNAASGLGLRYFSVLGAIRLDAGWRLPGLQRLGASDDAVTLGVAPSAVHFTIGEAF